MNQFVYIDAENAIRINVGTWIEKCERKNEHAKRRMKTDGTRKKTREDPSFRVYKYCDCTLLHRQLLQLCSRFVGAPTSISLSSFHSIHIFSAMNRLDFVQSIWKKIFTIIKTWHWASPLWWPMGLAYFYFCFCAETISQLFGSHFSPLFVSLFLLLLILTDKSMHLCYRFVLKSYLFLACWKRVRNSDRKTTTTKYQSGYLIAFVFIFANCIPISRCRCFRFQQ